MEPSTETSLELLRRLAERLRQKLRPAPSSTRHMLAIRLAVAAVSMMVGFASLRTVLLATVERHIAISVTTTIAAFLSGAAVSIVTRWRRSQRERRGHRLSAEIREVYREAILAAGLTGGKPS